MRHTGAALLLAGSVLAAAPAWAATTYNVSKVEIVGNKSVPTDQLMAVVQEHPGSRVTVDQIIADRDAISKVLENSHVVGSVKPSIRTQGSKSVVVFTVDDQGVQAPVVTHVAPKLDQEIFEGNASIPTATLAQASGLVPGEDLTNEKIQAAEQAIFSTYKAAKLPVSVAISGENKPVAGGKYDVIWHIVETKAKKKKRKADSDDEGFSGQ